MAKLIGKEGNKVTLEFTISAEEFKEAVNVAYKKTKHKYRVQGFRQGKAPRKMIENVYGEGVFYEDALNEVLPNAYDKAIEELDLQAVSKPDIDIKTFEAGKDVLVGAEIDVMPVVELPDHSDLTCEVQFASFDEAVFDAELEKQREMNARLVPVEGRKSQNGDSVIIDFEGSIDGTLFEGGSGENHTLVLGSKSFIPGFEDQLLDKSAGDEVDVNVVFPEDYGKEDLQGKKALFKVKIHEHKVKELPDADDDFASDVSEFDTLEEYKDDFLSRAKDAWEDRLDAAKKNAALKALADITVIDIPSSMVDSEIDAEIRDIDFRFRNDGFSLEQYMQLSGSNMDGLREQLRDNAEISVKNNLVVKALIDKMAPEVSDEEIDDEIKRAANQMGEDYEKIKEYYVGQEESIRSHLKTQKVLTSLLESTKVEVVEPKEEETFDAEVFEDAINEVVEAEQAKEDADE